MKENLNLSLILKDCPKGTKLYCTFLGDVTFQCIEKDRIIIKNGYDSCSLLKDGTFSSEGECVIFPSREQRDWRKFKVPIKRFNPKEFRPFDKVLLRDGYDLTWVPDFFEKILPKISGKYVAINISNRCTWKMCIPYNDDTKHLCGTSKDCPEYYKWWEE